MNLIVIIAIIVLLLLVIQSQEKFYSWPQYSCKNCNLNTPRQCGSCPHCGLCVTESGKMECVPGNADGPFFRKDCQKYYHNYWMPWNWPMWRSWYGSGYPRYEMIKYYKDRPQYVGNWRNGKNKN